MEKSLKKFFDLRKYKDISLVIIGILYTILTIILLIGVFIGRKLNILSVLVVLLIIFLNLYIKRREEKPRNYDELYKFEKLFVVFGILVLDILFFWGIYNRTGGQIVESLKSFSIEMYGIMLISIMCWLVFRGLSIYSDDNIKKPITLSRLIFEFLIFTFYELFLLNSISKFHF